jgi:hypothetical protein
VLIPEESRALPVAPSSAVNDQEWQHLINTIRQSKPHFPTLDEAMNVIRGRS